MNYYTLSFDYSSFAAKVKAGKQNFQIGKLRFPEDINKVRKAYAKNPDNQLGLNSFILFRVEDIIRAAFVLAGHPIAHQYSWPDGSLYFDSKSEQTMFDFSNSIRKYLSEFGIAFSIDRLNEEALNAPSHKHNKKIGTNFTTRKEYIDRCALQGNFI